MSASFSPPVLLDGNKCASVIQGQLAEIAAALQSQHGLTPGLDVLLFGDFAPSVSYVRGKKRAAERVGIASTVHHFPASLVLEEGLQKLEEIQTQVNCHGVLVQLPLPQAWSQNEAAAEAQVNKTILAAKDVDCFTIQNQGALFSNHAHGLKPCTPMGILALMKAYGLGPEAVCGKNICVIGRSHIVGNPLSHLLSQKPDEGFNLGLGDATVTQCNSHTKDLAAHCLNADVIISAAGCPGLVRADMAKAHTILIDVGINRIEDRSRKRGYRLVGDMDYEALLPKASHITPVPGGIGPMTITMLLYNTLQAACWQNDLPFPGLDWERIRRQITTCL